MSEALLAEGFDEALLGFGRRFNTVVAIYSYDRCVDLLVKRDGMSEDEAHEYMEYNVLGAFVGDQTPIYMVNAELNNDTQSLN